MESFSCQRIVVVGTTSSGKSTLAKQLAAKFHLAFVELDALHWEPKRIACELPVTSIQKAVDRRSPLCAHAMVDQPAPDFQSIRNSDQRG